MSGMVLVTLLCCRLLRYWWCKCVSCLSRFFVVYGVRVCVNVCGVVCVGWFFIQVDRLCHSLHSTTFGLTLVRKSFLDFSHLFHLFGSFHSSTYISPDVWRSDSR